MVRPRIIPFCFCIISYFITSFSAPSVAKSYKEHKMISLQTDDSDKRNTMQEFIKSTTGITVYNEGIQGELRVIVAPHIYSSFMSKASELGVKANILYNDVQPLIDATKKRSTDTLSRRFARSADTTVIDHSMYHTYTEITRMLKTLADANPDLMKLSNLEFKTHEGRDVTLVTLHGRMREPGEKRAIVVGAGTHAREWISPAVNLWLIEELLGGYKREDPDKQMMLDSFDWYIIPVTNPDGYEYSHKEDRMWRKNRRYISRDCTGVDMNRNYDISFNTTGVSLNCRDDSYLGHKPFSEPETSNVKSLVNMLGDRLIAYLSIHSYSQVILVPWGYSEETIRPPNWRELDRIAGLMNTEIQQRYGTDYNTGTAYDLLNYASSGAAEDWALSVQPGIFAICIELRPKDDDKRGFLLPPEEIIPAAEEYVDSLVVMARELSKSN